MKKTLAFLVFGFFLLGCAKEIVPPTKTEMVIGDWQLDMVNGQPFTGSIFNYYYVNHDFLYVDGTLEVEGTWSWIDSKEMEMFIDYTDPRLQDGSTIIESLTTTELIEIIGNNRYVWIKH